MRDPHSSRAANDFAQRAASRLECARREHCSVRDQLSLAKFCVDAAPRGTSELRSCMRADDGGLRPMTTEPMAGVSRAVSTWLREACTASPPIDAAPTRGVAQCASNPRHFEGAEALRQSVPSTTSLTLSKEPGMMRVGQGAAAKPQLGVSARRARARAPFRAGTASSRSRSGAGAVNALCRYLANARRCRPHVVTPRVVTPHISTSHQFTVKQKRSETLAQSLACAVLACSRTPTFNSELGQHARRAEVVTSAAIEPRASHGGRDVVARRAASLVGRPSAPANRASSRQVPSEHHPCPSL